MKHHPRNCVTSFITFIMMVASVSLTPLHARPAAAKIGVYERSLTRIKKEHSDALRELGKNYIKALENSAKKFQKAGDLDGLLSFNAELAHFRKNGTVPVVDDKKNHKEMLRLRALYTVARNKVDKVKYRTATKLNGNLLYYLENLQKKLTQEGKLEEAVIIRAEVARISKYQAGIPSFEPRGKNTTNQQRLVAWNGLRQSGLLGADGRPTFKYKFSHNGGNKMNGGTLHMKGGRTIIEGLNQQLLDSCKATNELSLVIHLDTDSLKQTGPARILSFSLNSMKRNFTLCQEKDKLVLRLRTTATGENGSSPEVVLCKLEEGQRKKVVITYRPGQLESYIDGKPRSIQQINGDFSNWEACQFVLGNEWKDDRSWKGHIHQFSIYSTVLPPKEALALSK